MKSFQFTCCVRIDAPDTPWHGELMPVEGLVTPPVKAENVKEAILSPEVRQYCEENRCTVYEIVRSWAG